MPLVLTGLCLIGKHRKDWISLCLPLYIYSGLHSLNIPRAGSHIVANRLKYMVTRHNKDGRKSFIFNDALNTWLCDVGLMIKDRSDNERSALSE